MKKKIIGSPDLSLIRLLIVSETGILIREFKPEWSNDICFAILCCLMIVGLLLSLRV